MEKLQHGYAAYRSDFLSRLSWRLRQRIFKIFMETFAPDEKTRVLDLGVMGNAHPLEIEANYFEKLYPYPRMLHGVTLEDPAELRRQFPLCTFTRADARDLPFPDQSFDLVFSGAVVEHVGPREDQRRFVREACRVGKNVFMATPNRYFPIEPHSRLPFVGYLPLAWFRKVLEALGLNELASEEKLNPLSESELYSLFDDTAKPEIVRIPLCFFTQNLAAILKRF